MISSFKRAAACVTAAFAILAVAAPVALAGHGGHGHDKRDRTLRFATFNASLNRNAAGQLAHGPFDAGQRRRLRTSPRSSSARGPTCC